MSKLFREPLPVQVDADEGQPTTLSMDGRRHEVHTVKSQWRVDERWRGGPARDYFLLVTDQGMWAIVFHDLISGAWFLQGIYD